MSIRLTTREQDLFSLLLEVASRSAPGAVLRVAGGWVRDKLLGGESSDIDISPDSMTGEAFARLVKAHLDAEGIRASDVTVIKANPAQSKHLATAMLRVKGLAVDFVQLRSEGYSARSRIPDAVRPGTAEEDASRRDLTINALFYNLNEDRVEDFVGGLADLEHRVARTPIDPYQTFMDDPLRVLRTVRFAAQLGLSLDPGLAAAARRPEVHRALLDKVSRERIWNELAWKHEVRSVKPGALSGADPVHAAALLGELGLTDLLLTVGPEELKRLGLTSELDRFDMDQETPHHTRNLWDHTLLVLEHLVRDRGGADAKERTVAALSALLHDIGKRYPGVWGTHEAGHRTYHRHEQISQILARVILEKLSAPSDVVARVSKIAAGHGRPRALIEGASDKAVRRFLGDLGDDWRLVVDLARADALAKAAEPREVTRDRYRALERRIRKELDLMGGTSPKRPVSGHDLKDIGVPPGPRMGELLRVLDEHLLENPAMTREEALALARAVMTADEK